MKFIAEGSNYAPWPHGKNAEDSILDVLSIVPATYQQLLASPPIRGRYIRPYLMGLRNRGVVRFDRATKQWHLATAKRSTSRIQAAVGSVLLALERLSA